MNWLKTLWKEIVDIWVYVVTNHKDPDTPAIEPKLPVDEPVAPEPLPDLVPPIMPTKREKLYNVAKGLIGQHVIPLDAANQYGFLGCAQSVNAVYKKTFGVEIGGGASTALMAAALKDKTRFIVVPYSDAQPGDIVMCATGTSVKYPQAHGHVAIMGVRWIMANSSEAGTWEATYTREGWTQYFTDTMGFPTVVYRILE